ncbi:DNA polymerase [Gordonia phage Yvonnetastic]|uniref:Uncharacterized protein n=1 Tax=Gordonia phage Yvonnetastic TaxID=1821566 RepID=A0A142K8X0_9CAUD|nr:DNA polymerase [Gordonia phage Yvonnetastic]AMS02553.1 hypothetical protein SEA_YVONNETASTIC_4 [Gordonia phage Yvonnetastic]
MVHTQDGEGAEAIYPYFIHRCWLPEGHFQEHRAHGISWPSEKWDNL